MEHCFFSLILTLPPGSVLVSSSRPSMTGTCWLLALFGHSDPTIAGPNVLVDDTLPSEVSLASH